MSFADIDESNKTTSPGNRDHSDERKIADDYSIFRDLNHDSKEKVKKYHNRYGGNVRSIQKKAHALVYSSDVHSNSRAPKHKLEDACDTSEKLLTLMSKRLLSLENLTSEQQLKIKEQDELILKLQRELNGCDASNPSPEISDQQIFSLREENALLHKQIREMCSFLKDYGLTWAGFHAGNNNIIHKIDDSSMDIILSESTRTNEAMFFKMDDMKNQIKELNSLVDLEVVCEKRLHSFKHPRRISLIFYKNGIFINNGPLRVYSLPEAQSFCKDILDGFFPFELRDEYPDGVHFDMMDCSYKEYGNRISHGDFIGSKDSIQKQPIHNVLYRIPRSVIHKGVIVPIRCDLSPTKKREREILDNKSVSNSNISRNETSAQVKCIPDEGSLPFTLAMKPNDSIDDLIKLIRTKLKSSKDFILKVSFPPRILNDHHQTLAEAGLVPKRAIYIVTKYKS
eukprot:42994_1